MINKKSLIVSYIIFGGIILIFPTILGMILYLTLHNYVYWESINVIFGSVGLIYAILNIRLRDSKNYKKNKSVYEDKKTPEYREYKYREIGYFIIASVSMLISLFVYLGLH